jgi:hypothetical protein
MATGEIQTPYLSSPLQVLAHPLLQEKALPHKDTRGVVQVKIIHPSPHVSVNPLHHFLLRYAVAFAAGHHPHFIPKLFFAQQSRGVRSCVATTELFDRLTTVS